MFGEKASRALPQSKFLGRAGRGLALIIGVISHNACSTVTTVDLLAGRSPGATAGAGGKPAGPGGAAASSANSAGFGAAAGAYGTAVGGGGALPLGQRLVNRYDFSGTGTALVDSVSGKNGEIMGGAALDGSGQLTLTGDPLQYVALPSWLISSMTSVTIVTWFTWSGGPAWQSVFNFGTNASNSATPSEDVKAEFFFTPLTVPDQVASFHVDIIYGNGNSVDAINAAEPIPADRAVAVAAVFDGERQQISLFVDGAMVKQSMPTLQHLSELKDANCWLGQSQWAHDVSAGGNFRGSYDEFRIYSGALTSEQIANLSLVDPNLL